MTKTSFPLDNDNKSVLHGTGKITQPSVSLLTLIDIDCYTCHPSEVQWTVPSVSAA